MTSAKLAGARRRHDVTFYDSQPNVDLAAHQFEVDLPSDVLISSTFSGLSPAQGGR